MADTNTPVQMSLFDVPGTPVKSELWGMIEEYYDDRKLKVPDLIDSVLWMVSEVGEVAEACVQAQGGWVRNTPGKDRIITPMEIGRELSDVILMAMRVGMAMGIDPLIMMAEKMQAKTGKTYVVRCMPLEREEGR